MMRTRESKPKKSFRFSLRGKRCKRRSELFCFVFLVVLMLVQQNSVAQTPDPMTFWNTPKFGGNSFNETPPDAAYFKALRATGTTWVRLTFSKWKGTGRDFLIKDADNYTGLSRPDLAVLIKTLDAANSAGVKVVLVPLTLPGDRWGQQNGGHPDYRIWNDTQYWKQSAAFWHDLAGSLKGHPALVAYNVVNEPIDDRKLTVDPAADAATQGAWYAKYKGTPHDLPAFYAQVIAAIREVDSAMPIMLDAGTYADPSGFSYWPAKQPDDRILYSFHMYHPYEATSTPNAHRNPPLRYPGAKDWYGPEEVVWDKAMLATDISSPFEWAAAHNIPSNRVVAGEFGCMRRWIDCGTYLTDVLDLLNGHHAHWAFYSFREDVWDGMDYELAPSVDPARFYDLTAHGKAAMLQRSPHPLLDIIEGHMATSTPK